MIFNFLMALAVMHFLLRPPQPAGFKKPQAVLIYLISAARIFGVFLAMAGTAFIFRKGMPDFADLLPGFMLLAALGAGKSFKLPEALIFMIFAAGMFLGTLPGGTVLFHAALISLGVSFVEWAMDGMRFRLAFTPSMQFFSKLPGLLTLLALTALVLSGFFTGLS